VPGASPVAFVGAYLLGLASATTFFAVIAVRRGLLRQPFLPSLRMMQRSMLFFGEYPLFTIPQSLVEVANERAVQLWIATAYSVETLGIFYLVRQTLVSAVGAFNAPIGQVVIANLTRIRKNPKRRAFIWPFFEVTAGIAGLMVGVGFVVAPIVFPIVLGSKFAAAAEYSPWLVAGIAALILSGWTDRIYYVGRRVGLAFGMNAIFTSLIVLSIVIAYSLHLGVERFVAAYGIALFFGNVLYAMIAILVIGFGATEIGIWLLCLLAGMVVGFAVGALANNFIGGIAGTIAAGAVITPISIGLVLRLLRKL
jgi:O-antigen/teichoic acid export membrane protein